MQILFQKELLVYGDFYDLELSVDYKGIKIANLTWLLQDVQAALLLYVFTLANIRIDAAKDQSINLSIQNIQWHLHPTRYGKH